MLRLSATSALLTTIGAWGQRPEPLAQPLLSANPIVVGRLTSATRISDADLRHPDPGRSGPAHGRPFACEITLALDSVLKANEHAIEVGATVHAVGFALSPACMVNSRVGEPILNHEALWLLRTENGIIRLSGVDSLTAIPLHRFSPAIAKELGRWTNPEEALTFLFLKPGIVIPENGYADSPVVGEVIPLCGWLTFLKVYREIFLESDAYSRGSYIGGSDPGGDVSVLDE